MAKGGTEEEGKAVVSYYVLAACDPRMAESDGDSKDQVTIAIFVFICSFP